MLYVPDRSEHLTVRYVPDRSEHWTVRYVPDRSEPTAQWCRVSAKSWTHQPISNINIVTKAVVNDDPWVSTTLTTLLASEIIKSPIVVPIVSIRIPIDACKYCLEYAIIHCGANWFSRKVNWKTYWTTKLKQHWTYYIAYRVPGELIGDPIGYTKVGTESYAMHCLVTVVLWHLPIEEPHARTALPCMLCIHLDYSALLKS